MRVIELFRFSDEGQSVCVEVARPEVNENGASYLAAEVVVKSEFVNGRVGLAITFDDVEMWGRCLDALADGGEIEWPAGGRSASVSVVPDDPLEIIVSDSPATQISVCVPVDALDWLDENRLLLARAREVLTESS